MARRKVDQAAEAFIRALAEAKIQEVRPENRTRLLEWIQENAADIVHKFDTVTPAKLALLQFDRRGEKNKAAKLTEADVIEMRKLFQGIHHRGIYRELARKHNVTPQTIYNIRDGVTWKHVQIPLTTETRKKSNDHSRQKNQED